MGSPPKIERLRSRKRIGELFAGGERGNAATVAGRALPSPDGRLKIAVAAGKKLGNAVQRNRMRRRLRAACRMRGMPLPDGVDLVLIAKRGLLEAKWRDVTRDVALAMKRATGRAGAADSGLPRPRPGA